MTAPLLAKLMARTNKTSGCWEWTGTINLSGYGAFAVYGIKGGGRKATLLAHRLMYAELVGPIPESMTLDHLCHNGDGSCAGGDDCRHRRCVNPAHLEPVPFTVNVLRGVGPTAVNARKTECSNGHPFDERNTYIRPNSGGRDCRICIRTRIRASKRRKREQRRTELAA